MTNNTPHTAPKPQTPQIQRPPGEDLQPPSTSPSQSTHASARLPLTAQIRRPKGQNLNSVSSAQAQIYRSPPQPHTTPQIQRPPGEDLQPPSTSPSQSTHASARLPLTAQIRRPKGQNLNSDTRKSAKLKSKGFNFAKEEQTERNGCRRAQPNGWARRRSEAQFVPTWSEWRDSNSRPPAPKAGALPTAQHPDVIRFKKSPKRMFRAGAAARIRTGDLILTKDALYLLSYSSI